MSQQSEAIEAMEKKVLSEKRTETQNDDRNVRNTRPHTAKRRGHVDSRRTPNGRRG